MKTILRYTLIFLLILGLVMAYLNERANTRVEQSSAKEWETVAKEYQKIPEYNRKAKDFVSLMNAGNGEHKDYLTGQALKEYEQAIESAGENINDAYIDTSLITTKIKIAETNVEENGIYRSKVLYELDMSTVADNPDAGIIDKRIVTYLIELVWEKDKVNRYEITWFHDTLGMGSEGESQ